MEVADTLKIIDIRRSEISDITFKFLTSNSLAIAYSDATLNEDMYRVPSMVDDINSGEMSLPECYSKTALDELKIMVKLCEEHDAAYVRIIDLE